MDLKIIPIIILFSVLVVVPFVYIGAITNPDPPKLTNATVGIIDITNYWSVPATHGGGGTLTYNITRSADGVTFSNLATTTSTSYTDSSPLIQDYGYYRIFSYDGGGQGTGYSFPLNQTISTNVRTHLPYDDVLTDQGKQDNTPTASGGAIYVAGHNGNARSFNGTNYDTMANESNFDFERTLPKTFSFWYNGNESGTTEYILDKSDAGAVGYSIIVLTDGTIRYDERVTGATNHLAVRTTNDYSDGTWRHIVITDAGTSLASGITFYVDGVAVSKTTINDTLSSSILNNQAVTIGAFRGTSNFLTASIDDFRIFYNYALDANEVEQLYYERLDTSDVIPPTTYNTPPTSLVASGESPTQIDLDWVAPAGMTNINGYRIQRETPIGTGWTTIVSNTTNTNAYYNNTGLSTNIIYNYRVYALNGTGISTPSNTYSMTTFHLPDAVTDLTGVATDFSTIDLSWSAPTSYAPAITGYMINGTTPTGEPVDILNANTGTSATTASALNILIGQEYSFRVSAITVHGKNATGNIWNGSTIQTFVIGNLTSPDVENTNDFKIFFDRAELNSTATQLNVTYPNSYDVSCDFSYKYARTNQTYSGLSTVPDGTSDQTATFVLINATGDLVQVTCWDTITGDESTYVLTITDFPFLQQVNALRSGEYGTFFQIGAFDGVMLIVIFLGMIGLNRTTPIVGIIFVVITTFAMTYFGLITYPVIMYPALIMMIVWAFVTTRKDD